MKNTFVILAFLLAATLTGSCGQPPSAELLTGDQNAPGELGETSQPAPVLDAVRIPANQVSTWADDAGDLPTQYKTPMTMVPGS